MIVIHILFLVLIALTVVVGLARLTGATYPTTEKAAVGVANNVVGAFLIVGCLIALAIYV